MSCDMWHRVFWFVFLMFVCPFIVSIILIWRPPRRKFLVFFICTQSALHVSGDVFAHHQEHLTVFTASDIVHLCCFRPVSWTKRNGVPSRPRHRPVATWVDYIRSCKYSQMPLMMGENFARNTYSWLVTNKKTPKFASCWSSIKNSDSCLPILERYLLVTFFRWPRMWWT